MNHKLSLKTIFLYAWILAFCAIEPVAGQFNEVEKITASDADAGDSFGFSVDISGNFAIVGAISKDTPGSGSTIGLLGATYIYKRNPGGNWMEVNKFIPAYLFVPETNMGASVAIDGDLAAAGAYYLANLQDAVYVYKNDGGTWSHLIRLYEPVKGFGNDIDLSGNRLIVGAAVGGEGSDFGRGKAFIYEYSGAPGYSGWTDKTILESSDAPAANFFGNSVAIDGNYAAVSASGDINTLAGQAVFVFEKDGAGIWNEVQKINPPSGMLTDNFGSTLSISGEKLVIGAPSVESGGVSKGAVYVFKRNSGGTWVLEQTLLASDGAQFDSFGAKADILGNKIIAGSRSDDDDGNDSGSAYLFTFDGTTWNEHGKYTASDASAEDRFGRDVAITDYFAIAGSPGDDDDGSFSGSAYILQHQLLLPGIFIPRLILQVFPNPNFGEFFIGATIVKPFEDNPKQELNIEFNQDQHQVNTNWEVVPRTAKLLISNSAGEEILSQLVKLPYLEEVDLTYYGPGVYFVTIDAGNYKETVRVLVEAP